MVLPFLNEIGLAVIELEEQQCGTSKHQGLVSCTGLYTISSALTWLNLTATTAVYHHILVVLEHHFGVFIHE